LRDCPSLEERFWLHKKKIWPDVMFRDVYSVKLWHYTWEVFQGFQIYLLDESGEPMACGTTAPFTWDGTLDDLSIGWDDSLVRSVNGQYIHI
jgi:hypothetical protein